MGRLFILTRGDLGTDYVAEEWGRPLAAVAAAEVPVLLENPSRQRLEQELAGMRIVAFFGHGTAGSLGAPAVIDEENIHRATGVVVALACRSAQVLGPAAVRANADAYVGFADDIPSVSIPPINDLVRRGFARLLAGEETPAEFERTFIERAQRVQDYYYDIGRRGHAYVVAMDASILKMALRVLERPVEPV